MQELFSTKQIKQIEKTIFKSGILPYELMQRAGKAVFNVLKEVYSDAQNILILCGNGNNGGDAYVVAELAYVAGYTVSVQYLGKKPELKTPEAKQAYETCLKLGVPMRTIDTRCAIDADVVIDGLVGIGLNQRCRKELLDVIQWVNEYEVPVVAIDAPSGLNVDTGCAMGDCIQADITVSMLAAKRGYYTADGPDVCGEIVIDDLDVDVLPHSKKIKSTHALTFADMATVTLGERLHNSHKGDYGHVLIVGGDVGMNGAALLSGLGALRVGAGKVTIATHPNHADYINVNHPELMVFPVHNAKELKRLMQHADVIVVGPGMGDSDWSVALYEQVFQSELPKIIDAGALRYLATHSKHIRLNTDSIVTPHPGEAAALLNSSSENIQEDRFTACNAIQKKYKCGVVLKGCGTLIQSDEHIWLCVEGNPSMASPGMGDLLSGMIAGVYAQSHNRGLLSTLSAVTLHAHCADSWTEETGSRQVSASDIVQLIPYYSGLL